MRFGTLVWTLVGCVTTLSTSEAAPPETLAGRPVGAVRIEASKIFDPEHPGERNFLFAWANALHVRTRETVIRRELLLQTGDPFDPRLAAQSERNLRNLGIFQDAHVVAEADGDSVSITVTTADRWSTHLVTDLRSEGDIHRLRLGIVNTNLLGSAAQLGATVATSNDLDAVSAFARDPRLLGSRWDLRLGWLEDDLVVLQSASLRRSFYSQQQRWSSQLDYESVRGARRIFESSRAVDSLDIDDTWGEAFVALHTPASRFGLLFTRRSVSREAELEHGALMLVGGWMRREFRRLQNVDRFAATEDVGSGAALQLGVGADLTGLGAARNRFLHRMDARFASFLGDSSLVGLALTHQGFVANGRLEQARPAAEVYGFWKHGAQVLAWNLGAAAFIREPRFARYALGGDARLRGYPARHLNGTRAMWLNLEERLFSDWRLFFLRFGASAFVDVAQAWDSHERPSWDGFAVGGGFGLRVGNNKSGASVTRIELSFGRDFGVEIASGSFFRAARTIEWPEPGLQSP